MGAQALHKDTQLAPAGGRRARGRRPLLSIICCSAPPLSSSRSGTTVASQQPGLPEVDCSNGTPRLPFFSVASFFFSAEILLPSFFSVKFGSCVSSTIVEIIRRMAREDCEELTSGIFAG